MCLVVKKVNEGTRDDESRSCSPGMLFEMTPRAMMTAQRLPNPPRPLKPCTMTAPEETSYAAVKSALVIHADPRPMPIMLTSVKAKVNPVKHEMKVFQRGVVSG